MKTINSVFVVVAMYAFFMISCEDAVDEPEGARRNRVQFERSTFVMDESASRDTIWIHFDKPTLRDGQIVITSDKATEGVFNSSPAFEGKSVTILYVKGDRRAALAILPMDNLLDNEDKVVNLAIASYGGDLSPGANKTLELTIKDDENAEALESIVNFIDNPLTVWEEAGTAITYQLHLSEPAAANSSIGILINSSTAVYGTHLQTLPETTDGKLLLLISKGQKVASFQVVVNDNEEIGGELSVDFSITETTGSLTKGTLTSQRLIVRDDELKGFARGYETVSGNDIRKEFYEYDSKGRRSRLHWQTYTPFLREGIDAYNYDNNDRLLSIDKSSGKSIHYTWTNDRIVKAEARSNNLLTEYAEYDYDENGNVSGSARYFRQQDNTYKRGLVNVYLYFTDGNIYKTLTYAQSGDEEPVLVSTRTYEAYTTLDNPFPMVEILPNIKSQTLLAGQYRVEEAGTEISYNLTYVFNDEGRPEKRIASSIHGTQTAVYFYY